MKINRLKPNMGRTAPLTPKRCILYIYSTNTGIEYFKHALYSPFFFSSKCSLFHNANLFGSCIIHILYTGCAEIKKKVTITIRILAQRDAVLQKVIITLLTMAHCIPQPYFSGQSFSHDGNNMILSIIKTKNFILIH